MEQIRRGQAQRSEFMQQIKDFVRDQVEALRGAGVRSRRASQEAARTTAPLREASGSIEKPLDCPACGSPLVEKSFDGVRQWRCSGLQRPDCRVSWTVGQDGEPVDGRCASCHSPRRRDRAGRLQCLHCGRPAELLAEQPPLPPLLACARCRQLARLLWSPKKNAWLQRCDRCDLWLEPLDPARLPPEPAAPPCSACGHGTAVTWSVQQKRYLWRCTACRQWAFV